MIKAQKVATAIREPRRGTAGEEKQRQLMRVRLRVHDIVMRERAPLFYFRAPFEVWARMHESLREHADVTGKLGAEPIARSHKLGT